MAVDRGINLQIAANAEIQRSVNFVDSFPYCSSGVVIFPNRTIKLSPRDRSPPFVN